ncbi:FRIGIDA-like protein 3 [Ricinus communis]|uniref:FRIGIDA-like protein n=1 Tax=Ricinus communis TaxID=3988 RepID=B9SG32_RICCO|nr:FRIGIDA-like protein 3 [Ricinus communis]XP_048233406.1 FRIGIDA-like protein 3 [Ricinus communis]EEF37448.1 Protein FRIGIDA, putative [Ricinus communis]|eukprot:XP_002524951.1 FRIGIDA-like protein 3 [Ricinus communis]
MTNSEQGAENNNASSLIEQLGRALHQLEAHRDASEDRVRWMEIEQHFCNLDTTLKRKFEELEAREKEYMDKEAETHALLTEREAAVAAKEQDFQDRMQELKDAAVAVIAEARANHQPIMLASIDGGDNKDSKVSSSLGDTNSPEEDSPHKMGENAESVAVDVKPRPELTQFCEQMDARGLLNFTIENQKNLYTLREELSVALESVSEPARLVLDSLEAFYPPLETTQPMDKKDAALQGKRKSCIMFMEAMASLLARIDPGADHLLNPEIKQQAKAIADEWKPKLASAGTDATNGNSLEADAFLQLLSTFRIASEFDEEELCKHVLVVARRRQAPELCRSLGLTHKMPGIIELLIKNGKQVEAVRFIHAFQLAESFPPVPLLKTYLKDFRRNSQGKGGNIGGATGQIDINAQELATLKAVIRCVEEYKLEADYPLDPLQRRVAQLAKSKSDKKRTGDFNRHHQSKKPRANGGYRRFRGGAAPGTTGVRQAPPVYAERTPYTGMPERYPHVGPNPYDYQIPSQSAYGQPATDQRMYYYPADDRVPTGSYDAAPSSYSSYMGTGMRPSHQPYM